MALDKDTKYGTGFTSRDRYTPGSPGASRASSPRSGSTRSSGPAKPVTSSTRSSGGGSFGRNVPTYTPKEIEASRAKGVPRLLQKPEEPPMTFADYLAQAASMLGGGEGGGAAGVDLSMFDRQAGTTSAAGNEADAKLAAMYRQLKDSFGQDATKIDAQYDRTKAAQAQAADQGAAAVQEGYGAATSQLTDQLKNLGIEDAIKVAANNGTTLQGDQADALSNIAQNKTASLNSSNANQAAAQDYNRQIGQAADLEGGTQRALNQRQMASALQEIAAGRSAAEASAQSSGGGTSQSDILGLAQQLYENQQGEVKSQRSYELDAGTLANQINKTQTSQTPKSNLNDTYLALLKQYDGDAEKANTLLKQMQSAGLVQ